MLSAVSQRELFTADAVHPQNAADDGEAYAAGLTPEARRAQGITFTPPWLVERMLDAVESTHAAGGIDTIVDAGAGSGRFTLAAAKRFPNAHVLAIEQNPVLAARLHAAVQREGLASHVTVIQGDFRDAALPLRGRTLFIGNPPYVRHHDIPAGWKDWYRRAMAQRAIAASQLAGLHAHFFLRVAELARTGDAWCLVTAAEWLDNGYGSAIRQLLTMPQGLGMESLWLAPPDEPVFPDALVSAVVVKGTVGSMPAGLSFGRMAGRNFQTVRQLDRDAVQASRRWSPLCQTQALPENTGIELGELFRVTRGQVTGLNVAWILPEGAPASWRELAVPAVTRAREIIDGTVVAPGAAQRLRRVVDLPRDLAVLDETGRGAAGELIQRAAALGADKAYVARQRTPWYAVGMREPPTAFVSYMGRRPPVFQPNPQQVSFINIAHGLYARAPFAAAELSAVLGYLNAHTRLFSGRVYGGGLAKFEPSDISRLRIPQAACESAR